MKLPLHTDDAKWFFKPLIEYGRDLESCQVFIDKIAADIANALPPIALALVLVQIESKGLALITAQGKRATRASRRARPTYAIALPNTEGTAKGASGSTTALAVGLSSPENRAP